MDTKNLRVQLTAVLSALKRSVTDLEARYTSGDEDIGRYLRLKTKHETLIAELEMLLARTSWDEASAQRARDLIAQITGKTPRAGGAGTSFVTQITEGQVDKIVNMQVEHIGALNID